MFALDITLGAGPLVNSCGDGSRTYAEIGTAVYPSLFNFRCPSMPVILRRGDGRTRSRDGRDCDLDLENLCTKSCPIHTRYEHTEDNWMGAPFTVFE